MRIVAGSAKGRRLRSRRGMAIRPTADRVREALFSILASRFELSGAHLLDLFAGTGAVGIEALSRGAERVVFVEQSRTTLPFLRENIALCGFEERAEVWPLAVDRALRRLAGTGARFDGVFLDPPYGHGLVGQTLGVLAAGGLVRAGGWVVAECGGEESPDGCYGVLRLTQTRRYGKTSLVLFQADPSAP